RYSELIAEIAQRKEAEERARLLAETDPLTGCLNRRSLLPAAGDLIARCSGTGSGVAFVLIDLDNFKQINDLNGHAAGDRVLRETTDRIRALLPRDALVARLGGDEFACVLPYDSADPEALDRLVRRMIDRIADPVDI